MRIDSPLLVLLVLLCLSMGLSGCGGGDNPGGGEVKTAHLNQTGPGADPVIRVGWEPSRATDPANIVAWLVYRDETYGLAAEPRNLIEVVGARSLRAFDDLANGHGAVTFNQNFTYFRFGAQETGSVDITYSHPPLTAGRSYYYRARLVVKPHSTTPPISTGQASSFAVDPSDALTEASVPQGPVTYFLPPTQNLPSNGVTSIDPRYVQFTWTTTAGADEYQVRVYNDYSATGTPVLQSPVQRPTGAWAQYVYNSGGSASALKGNTTYYWVVGARRSGQSSPTSGTDSGWLKSAVRQFGTVALPPGAP